MIFGNWRPGGLALGAGLFGYTDAVQLRDEAAVHSLLLFVAALLAVLGVWSLARRRSLGGVLAVLAAIAVFAWWALTDEYPTQFVGFTPHIPTLLVLARSEEHTSELQSPMRLSSAV